MRSGREGIDAQQTRRGNAHAKCPEFLADPSRQGRRTRGVAMETQSFKRYGHSAAVTRQNFTIGDQRANLVRHRVRIDQHGLRAGAGQKRAVGPIAPVGEGLGRERMSEGLRGLLHRRAGPADQPQPGIECPIPAMMAIASAWSASAWL